MPDKSPIAQQILIFQMRYSPPVIFFYPLLNPNPTETVLGLYTKGKFWTWIFMHGLVKSCNRGQHLQRNLCLLAAALDAIMLSSTSCKHILSPLLGQEIISHYYRCWEFICISEKQMSKSGILCFTGRVSHVRRQLKVTCNKCCVFIGIEQLSDSDTEDWDCFRNPAEVDSCFHHAAHN